MVTHLGEDALAATTAGSMNAFAFLILPIGTVFIVSAFSAQMLGRGDAAGARRFAYYGLFVALAAELFCLAMMPLMARLVGLGSHPPAVASLMADYLVYRLSTAGAAVGLEAIGNYYAGVKNTLLPMSAQVLAMVLNVAFCWVLIYGHLGAPALGVRGSAIAGALATLIAFVFLLACFLARVGQPARESAPGSLRLRELWRMLRYGIPSGLNWFIEFAAFIVFIDVVVAELGATALAAMMAVFQINSVSFMPAFGIANAGSIFVGNAIGAGKQEDVGATVALTMKVAVVWQTLVGVGYLVAPALLLAPFAPAGSVGFMATGVVILRLSSAWQAFDAAANTLAEALRAAGDTTFSSFARAAIAWGVFFPGVYVSVHVLGGRELVATGWMVAYLCLLALVLAYRFRSGKWRGIELTEPALVG
jgi:MATE family multidrug resistance protein